MRTTPTPLKLAVASVAAIGAGALIAPSAQALLTPANTPSGLSDATVIALYEEERLAGDVYDQLAGDTGAAIFSKIGASEDRHQSSVATLLEARGISTDDLPSAPGDYQTGGYDELYDRFVSEGQESLTNAYEVGLEIETTDIDDLQGLLDQTEDPAEVQVLTALLDGSTNHLAAFERALDATSGTPSTGHGQGQGGPGGQHGMRHSGETTGPKSSTPGECDGSGRQDHDPQDSGSGYRR